MYKLQSIIETIVGKSIIKCVLIQILKITGQYYQNQFEMDQCNPSTGTQSHVHNDTNNFDDVPIRATTQKFVVSEFADGGPPPAISTASLTLQQKINSKIVKVKLEGLDQLKDALNNNNSQDIIAIQLAAILRQNNPACLQKALLCAEKWIQLNKSWNDRQVKQIIENGCTNGKGNTKKIALNLLFKIFELRPQIVQQVIVQTGLKAKMPKTIGGYLAVLNQLLQQFGIKDLRYLKPYLPTVVNVMNNEKLPVVKNQAMNLIKAGLKWLGKDFIWPALSDLKQNMKKQLQSFWEGHDKKQIIKANRQKNDSAGSSSGNPQIAKQKSKYNQNQQPPQQENGIDVYEISDPIQIFQKFDEKWSENVLQTQKWSEKTGLLQQLICKSSVPKINNSEHRHITQMMRRLLGDSNFNVVLTVLKLAGVLAKGLRKNFNHSAKILFPYITPKFRDKKTQMIQETSNTLNNFYYCLSIQQVGQDVKTSLKDKSAGMKNNVIKWLTTQIQRKHATSNSNLDRTLQYFKAGSFQTIIQSLLNDPTPQVRDSTAKLVIKAKTIFGDAVFKNIDKGISNKDLLNKLNDGGQFQQSLAKSRSKEAISGKKGSRNKSTAKRSNEEDQMNQKTYNLKIDNKGQKIVDLSEQLNRNLKKLNDNTNWQNRKQSAQHLIKYFDNLQRQKPNAKINSSSIHDFLGILKSRISDPNKQLIKIFVSLVGKVFRCLEQKQLKIHARIVVQQLIEALSDKNDANRKQIYRSFDLISANVGNQVMIAYIGQIICQQSINTSNNQIGSTSKQYALEYLINSEYFTNKIEQLTVGQNLKQFKQFPKLILSGLCDKNKDLRSVCQKLFKSLSQKIGIEVFRNYVNSKQQKSAFKNDLINFLDKFQNQSYNQQPSMMSNYSFLSLNNIKQAETSRKRSPSINQSKIGKVQVRNGDRSRRKVSNVTSFNSSRSKKNNSVLDDDGSKQHISNSSFMLKCDQNRKISGQQYFADIAYLTSERVLRQQSASRYRNKNQNHPIFEQTQTYSILSRLVNYEQIYSKMVSSDYRKNIQVSQKLIKICRDISFANSIRQLWDLFIKWIIIKIHGANISTISLIQLVCPLLTVLEKKKVAWTDYDIDLVIFLNRQYIISSFFQGNFNIQTIKNVFKIATALSSGERIIKKILVQLKTDISQCHRFLITAKRDGASCSAYYKRILSQICEYFADYFSHNGLLEEASTIPDLRQNKQFLRLLCNRFQDTVLRQFGFNIQSGTPDLKYDSNKQQKINPIFQKEGNKINNSRNVSPSPLSRANFMSGKLIKVQERSQKKTPQKPNLSNNSGFYESHYPPPSPITKSNLITPTIPTVPIKQSIQSPIFQMQKHTVTMGSMHKNIGIELNSDRFEIDLSVFTPPSQHNPLGSNLLRLYPYNQSTVHFFSTLFQPQNQNSEKIALELSSNSNVIYGFLFNSLIKMMELSVRDSQSPDRLCAFMTLVQHSIKCPNIFKNLNQQIIEKSMRYTVDQLVYEDENRNTIESKLKGRGFADFRGDAFIKGINGIMLRLLDNSPPLFIINCLLLNLLQTILQIRNYHEPSTSLPIINKHKKVGLLIRCITRATTSYFGQKEKDKQKQQAYNVEEDPSCLKPSHISRFVLICKQYLDIMDITDLVDFQSRENAKTDKSIIANISTNTQESVAFSLCKILKVLHRKNLLGKLFQSIKKQKIHMRDQRTISEYIRHISDLSTSFLGFTGVLGNSNYQQQNYLNYQSPQIDQQLRKIIQLLSKVKTFNDGIKLLKQYIQQSGNKFDFKSCFLKMNFQISFIEKVGQEMSKLNTVQTHPTSRVLNPDIQDKLQRLKMKLQGINSEYQSNAPDKNMEKLDKLTVGRGNSILGSNSSNNIKGVVENKTPRGRDLSSRSIQMNGPAQTDLKKRIQEMKNKVNMAGTSRIR